MLLLALLSLLFLVFSLIASGHALLNKRDSRSALGWVALCMMVPYGGVILYLLFGVNRAHTSAQRMRPSFAGELRSTWLPDSPQISQYPMSVIGLNVTRSELLPVDSMKMLCNGNETYPAMLEAIENARHTVYLATYLFNRGEIADRFIAAMSRARDRGVEVRILLDGMGEYMGVFRIGHKLKDAKLPFVRFNPLTLLPISLHMNLRNHRKLLIVDTAVAFTGGINIADGNCLEQETEAEIKKGQIQDVHFRLTGQIVTSLERYFLLDWHYAYRHERSSQDAGPVPLPENAPAGAGNSDSGILARVVTDGPNEDIDKISDTLTGIFSCAKTRIWIMTPYFLPDAEVTGALQAACLRNLDVRVIMTSDNNIPMAHRAARHQLWQLLNYGVKCYYQQPPFNHSKLILVDDDYAMIGSANLDPRSLRLNFELNVEVFGKQATTSLTDYCENKLTEATPYTRHELRQRSLPTKLMDAICCLFSPYL